MTDYVLSSLTKRRAELAGEAETLRARIAQIGTDLGHLDAVIRQFDPDYDLGAIRPKRPRGPDAAGRGEMSRAVLGVLREAAAPMTTADIVQRITVERGMDAGDQRAQRAMAKRVGMALGRQRKAGVVRAEQGPGQVVVWDVVR